MDQSYAIINLGPNYTYYSISGGKSQGTDGGSVVFEGVRFSEALPIGPPGSFYQIDML